MEVRLEYDGPFAVVHLRGDLRLWGKQGMADNIRKTVLEAVKSNLVVLINLTEAHTVDSRGIGCLARCLASAVAQGGELRLVVLAWPPAPCPGGCSPSLRFSRLRHRLRRQPKPLAYRSSLVVAGWRNR